MRRLVCVFIAYVVPFSMAILIFDVSQIKAEEAKATLHLGQQIRKNNLHICVSDQGLCCSPIQYRILVNE